MTRFVKSEHWGPDVDNIRYNIDFVISRIRREYETVKQLRHWTGHPSTKSDSALAVEERMLSERIDELRNIRDNLSLLRCRMNDNFVDSVDVE